MTFTPGQLVICTDANELCGVRHGRVYRITETMTIHGIPAVAIDETPGHFFASRFRPISARQIATVNSLMNDARVFAALKRIGGRFAA